MKHYLHNVTTFGITLLILAAGGKLVVQAEQSVPGTFSYPATPPVLPLKDVVTAEQFEMKVPSPVEKKKEEETTSDTNKKVVPTGETVLKVEDTKKTTGENVHETVEKHVDEASPVSTPAPDLVVEPTPTFYISDATIQPVELEKIPETPEARGLTREEKIEEKNLGRIPISLGFDTDENGTTGL